MGKFVKRVDKWGKWGVVNLSTHMEKTYEDYKRDSDILQSTEQITPTTSNTQTTRNQDRTQTVLGR